MTENQDLDTLLTSLEMSLNINAMKDWDLSKLSPYMESKLNDIRTSGLNNAISEGNIESIKEQVAEYKLNIFPSKDKLKVKADDSLIKSYVNGCVFLEDYESAYQGLKELKPESELKSEVLGLLAFKAGNYDSALENLAHVNQTECPLSLSAKALSLINVEGENVVLSDVEDVFNNSENPLSVDILGALYFNAKQYEKAKTHYEKFKDTFPQFELNYLRCLEAQEDPERFPMISEYIHKHQPDINKFKESLKPKEIEIVGLQFADKDLFYSIVSNMVSKL